MGVKGNRGRRGSRRTGGGESRPSPSFKKLDPDDGPFSLNWTLVDRSGPFAWPETHEPTYQALAGFLARLNEMSLAEVMAVERSNSNSAIHAVDPDECSEAGRQRWAEFYEERGIFEGPYSHLELIAMTYCLAQYDSRRVFVALDGDARVMYPLWWDPEHAVSGDNGRPASPAPCSEETCFHSPEAQAS